MSAADRLRPSPEVLTLAAELDSVLFSPATTDAGLVCKVDAALVRALGGIEWMIEHCSIDDPDLVDEKLSGRESLRLARTTFDLIVDVRHRRLSRPLARTMAGVLLQRAVGRFGIEGPLHPLVQVLAALTVLPGADDDRSLDPTPDPAWPLETAVAACLRDPGHRPAFLRSVAAEQLHLPVLAVDLRDAGAHVQFAPIVIHGRPAIAAYTSPDRMVEHTRSVGVEAPGLILRGDELAGVLPAGHGLAVNPGSLLGLVMSEAEVVGLAGRHA